MAKQIVNLALETIRDLLVEEAKFLHGVRDEVAELETELSLLNSYLNDANAKSHEKEKVRKWLHQAKRLAYRAEDVLEAYVFKVSSRKGQYGFKEMAKRVGKPVVLHKVGRQISEIKKEIASLTASLQTYGIHQIIETQPSVEEIENKRKIRTTYGHEVQQYFVGMEDDLRKLVTWSVEDTMVRRIISICGIAGLGKTTLAKKVYNHPQVKQWFDVMAWVCITDQCQTKNILQDILIQFLGDKESGNIRIMEESEVVRKLYEFQKEKKCLVVLDDMWKLVDWEILRHAFPIEDSSSKSKILITTRNEDVAKVAHHSSQHEPSCLNKEDGFKLLKLTAFQEDQGQTILLNVEQIGREMVEKCGGLPLAISAIGGILRNKNRETEWENVNNDIDKYLRKEKGALNILALSYDTLPFYLKPCFLYMCLFPEDKDILTKDIYHLWMAEGLVSSRGRQHDESLMDVAQEYLNELASRNMVQVDMDDLVTPLSRILNCKLHDLMRELCLAKVNEEQFFEVRRSECSPDVVSSSFGGQNSCRLAILADYEVENVLVDQKQVRNRYLRALYVSHSQIIGRSRNLKMLRSLVLDGCKFEERKLPREIGDMIYLRLLSLNECRLYELPSFVGNLTNLQILRAGFYGQCHDTNIFKKMKKLRYLRLPYNYSTSSPVEAKRIRLNGLNELECIDGFNSRFHQHTGLSKLVNIQDFSGQVYGCETLSTFLVQISNWQKLRFMDITVEFESVIEKNFTCAKELFMCSTECHLRLYNPIGKLPRYEPQLCRNFIRISLMDTLIEEDPMQFLKELPHLMYLELQKYSFVGKEMCCGSKSFPKLKSIEISMLPNIEIWKLDAGAMPNLSSICIFRCKIFKIVPDGFNNLTSLARIDMPDGFKKKYGELPSKSIIRY